MFKKKEKSLLAPKTIQIGAYEYNLCPQSDFIIYRDELHCGLVNHENFTIQYTTNCSKQKIKQILLHEMFHCFHYYIGIEEYLETCSRDFLKENFAKCLLTFIKENPAFIKWIIPNVFKTKAKRPKNIKIGCYDYKIKYKALHEKNFIDYDELIIEIHKSKNFSFVKLQENVLDACIDIIFDYMGIDFNLAESIVDNLATGLLELFNKNESLIAWLIAEKKDKF